MLDISVEKLYEWAGTTGAEVIWRSWMTHMLKEDREVAEERLSWETLPDKDKILDALIARDVVTALLTTFFLEGPNE